MGIAERREREKTERRKTILNSARELILTQGVERVSMEEIARKAEFSKATVYLYFSSKEALFNEICEESSRIFFERFTSSLDNSLSGLAALKCFWRGYVDVFGKSDEMIIIFQVRTYLNSWPPVASPEEQAKSPYMDAILATVESLIDQCKAEGIFDPDLNSAIATRLLLSMFSLIVGNAVHISPKPERSAVIVNEMTVAFQIMIRGFAKEGMQHSLLDITSA